MYTACTIRFTDDETNTDWDVIIKDDEEFDPNDDWIFFYGLSREALLDACTNGVIIENEWIVTSVDDTFYKESLDERKCV